MSTTRRELLKRSAAAGAVVWAVPVITSFEPAAAAVGSISCPAVFCFDNGTTNGWTIDNTWGVGAGLWRLDSSRSVSAPSAMHYGTGAGNPDGYKSTGKRNSGRVYSPTVRLPSSGAMNMSFSIWRDIQPTGSVEDEVTVTVSTSAGTSVLYNAKAPNAAPFWTLVSAVIPTMHWGLDAVFTVTFDTIDNSNNAREGIWFDNFTVPCAYPPL